MKIKLNLKITKIIVPKPQIQVKTPKTLKTLLKSRFSKFHKNRYEDQIEPEDYENNSPQTPSSIQTLSPAV